MSNACRVTDMCSGHDGFPSRSAISGSANVFINGLAAHRVSDSWESHSNVSSHESTLESGSSSVFVNGLPLGRVGDSIGCGSYVQSGSADVFAG